MSQIARIFRDKAINERVRISPEIAETIRLIHKRRPAYILYDPDIALIIRMDSFETAAAHTTIKGTQTMASSSDRIEIGAHLDDTAGSCAKQITRLLGKEQRLTEWVPC